MQKRQMTSVFLEVGVKERMLQKAICAENSTICSVKRPSVVHDTRIIVKYVLC